MKKYNLELRYWGNNYRYKGYKYYIIDLLPNVQLSINCKGGRAKFGISIGWLCWGFCVRLIRNPTTLDNSCGRFQKLSKEINWEQRRYELAKSAMQGYCIAFGLNDDSDTYENIAKGSIRVADSLIAKLKKGIIE